MFLGSYDFSGEPDDLLAAYDRLMDGMPPDGLPFHACVARDGGITIYDCCPSAEVFAAFSTSDMLREALSAAGLPEPVVTRVGDVHVARTHDVFITE